MIPRPNWAPLVAVIASGVLGGCGGSGLFKSPTTHAARRAPAPASGAAPGPAPPENGPLTIPTPPPTGIPADPAAVVVIRAWSDALRRGDLRGAARYFALPSVMINGTDVAGDALITTIATRAEAEAANESLPCGARFVSADQRGRYVNVLFRLTNRPGPGGGCGAGVGQTARTNFLIRHGLIVEWIRAPDEPGDNGPSTTPTPTVPVAPPESSGNV